MQSCQGHFCCSCAALLQGLAGFKVMEQLIFTTISPILQSVSGFTGACCRNLAVNFSQLLFQTCFKTHSMKSYCRAFIRLNC